MFNAAKTRMTGLPYGEKTMMIWQAVFIWYRNVTDGQTDGQTDRFAISISRVNMLTRDRNWLTFGSDPVPDAHSGSLFHFPRHWGIGRDLLAFVIQSADDFQDTWRNDWRRQDRIRIHNILRAMRQPSGSESGNPYSNPRWFSIEVRHLGGG